MTVMCIEASNRIIDKTNAYNATASFADSIIMSCKRLQKLLYFSEVWYMIKHDKPMLTDNFCAWPNGPVIPGVYDIFLGYQDGFMKPFEPGKHTQLSQDEVEAIDEVFNYTTTMDTGSLVKLSHIPGGPWELAMAKDTSDGECGPQISKDDMMHFYCTAFYKQGGLSTLLPKYAT